MKKLIFVTMLILNVALAVAQTGINYQAIARNSKGEPVISDDISVRFSIHKASAAGVLVYQEIHNAQTNKYGLFNVIIGKGTRQDGVNKLEEIDWGTAVHFLKVEVKFDYEYIDFGTTQFQTVPYALYALKSGSSNGGGGGGDQELILNTNTKTLDLSNNGGSVKVSDLTTYLNVDKDSTNELQTLVLEGNTLKIKHGNTVDGSVVLSNVDNDKQTLSLEGNILRIENGNSVTLNDRFEDADADPTNEIQNLSITTDGSNRTLALSKANSVSINVDDADANSTNEIQDLYEANDSIYLTKNGQPTKVSLKHTLSVDKANNKLSITRGGTAVDIDADPKNEIQDLTLTGNTLKVTNNATATNIDLTKYTDDKQNLTLDEAAKTLSIERGNSVNVSNLVNVPWEGFSYNNNSGVAINGGQESLIAWNKEFDDGNLVQSNALVSTANNAVYSLSISLSLNVITSVSITIYKNGTLYRTFPLYVQNFCASFPVKLNVGETISVKIKNDGSFSTNLIYSYFSGYRIH